VVFEADYDEIELQNIVMTSFTKKRHQNKVTKFFQFGPLPIKISGYASGLGLIIWWLPHCCIVLWGVLFRKKFLASLLILHPPILQRQR